MLNSKKQCIACGSAGLRNVLDLGVQAPANNLLNNQDDKDYLVFPLGIDACNDCGHGQLSHFVDPGYLFSNYYYVSSTSKTMKDHMDKLANFVLNLKGKDASVLELGSNDGLFLKCLNEVGINNVLGVDPAENIVNEANEQGLKTILGFWPEAGDDLESFSYDMVIGQNVFAHTPDPLSALKEVKRVLKQDGYAIFQTSQADMVYNGEFDTTYHEHCSFFCEESMAALAKRAGLQLAYTHYVDIHGGSSLYILTQDYSSADKMSIELSAISAGLAEVEPANDIAGMLRASRTPEDWDIVCPVTFTHKGVQDRIRLAIEDRPEYLKRVKLVHVDLASPMSTVTAHAFGKIDYVFNLASESTSSISAPKQIIIPIPPLI